MTLAHHGEGGALLDVEPVAKPRMTRRDRWKRRPAVVRYHDYCDRVRDELARLGIEEVAPGGRLRVQFILPMPASWSKRRRASMAGAPHQSRPDVDNLVKGLLDAALPDGDAGVWQVRAEKYWGGRGGIILWVGNE